MNRGRSSRNSLEKKSDSRKRKGRFGSFENDNFNGKYEYIRNLGEGSYGFVCEAAPTGPSEHSRVAIKKVVRIFNNQIEARRMLRELRLLRKLSSCGNIVGLLDILPPKNLQNFTSLNIVLEFVATDLGKLFSSEQYWDELHVTWILYQLLLGLKFMHSAKICHRDLKPANILVTEKCSVRICDFGLARCWMVNKDHKPNPQSKGRLWSPKLSPVTPVLRAVSPPGRTITDRMNRIPTHHVVTRWYRSPEVILLEQDWEHMGAIDMWSVGCIMAELMNMSEGNCSKVRQRRALFPGSSSYPLSPYSVDDKAQVQNTDQLKMIFRVIGTPTDAEIEGFTQDEVKKYLRRNFRQWSAKDFESMFPASPLDHVDLLKNLIKFDRCKRFTVDQALAHRALKERRMLDVERECEPEVFEFEDLELPMETLRDLLVDEVLYYNDDIMRQCGLKRSTSQRTLVPRPSFCGTLPLDLKLFLEEKKDLDSDPEDKKVMEMDEDLVPPMSLRSPFSSRYDYQSSESSDSESSYQAIHQLKISSPMPSRGNEEKKVIHQEDARRRYGETDFKQNI